MDTSALTTRWETLGISDREIAEEDTLTLGATIVAPDQEPGHLLLKLPRLRAQGQRDAAPELALKGTLGQGGMGVVYLAEQLSLGRDVAVKKVRGEESSQESTLALLREGWTTGLLEHPNIVPIHSMERDEEDRPSIVMKRVSGISWDEILADPSKAPATVDSESPLELHLEILHQVCNALEFAHSKGVIHRDLKPENVMIGEFGEVYVLDWGIAVSLQPDPTGRLAYVGDVTMPAGTPSYMAPEMAEGRGEVLGVHTDVFLLGALLYEILEGRALYEGSTLYALLLKAYDCASPEFSTGHPEEILAICRRALQREPSARFGDVRSFQRALQVFRRNQEARRLAEEGESLREELELLLGRERDGEEIDEPGLYKSFGVCRFAFEQALRRDPENSAALQGLQAALEALASRELDREAPEAAALLIADLPGENQELQERLSALQRRASTRMEELKELQQIRHDVDLEVGERPRMFLAIILGFLWTAMAFGTAFFTQIGALEITSARAFGHIVGLTALMGAGTWIFRKRIYVNALNRRLSQAILVTFLGSLGLRGLAWFMGIDVVQALVLESLYYGAVAAALSMTVDRRLLVLTWPFALCAILAAVWTEHFFWLFAMANLVGMALIAWKWSSYEDRC